VDYGNGCTLRQFCYYSGSESEPMVNPETPYLVNLPTSKLIDFFRDYLAYPLPTRVELGEAAGNAEIEEMAQSILEVFAEIQQERNERIDDALFTQPVMAMWMAKQQIKTYKINRHVAAIQICYAIGEPPEGEEIPKNLIFLPEDRMSETIYEKSCRPPKVLIPSPFDSIELMQQGEKFLGFIQQQFQQWINQKYVYTVKQARSLKIDFSERSKKPMRVMIFACYYTTVMRYALESMAQAFEKLGCEVLFLIDDPYSYLIGTKTVEAYLQFKPHLTFNINHLNNEAISPDTFNIIWWQDLMEDLQKSEPFRNIRPRDFHYAFGDYILEGVKNKGVEVHYQEQCADENIYFPPSENNQRRNVVVFVGSAYAQEPKDFAKHYGEESLQKVLTDYEQIFNQPIVEAQQRVDLIHRYIETHTQYHQFYLTRLWIYYCRTTIIHALIDNSPYPIELYGYDWQDDPKTAPYYQGSIENGQALADLYRSVKYGLSVQPFMTGHQRLAEIKFCGAIPLVFWTPNRYEHTDYRKEVVAFESLDELSRQLNNAPTVLPDENIRHHFSYINFAQCCLQQVENTVEASRQEDEV